MITPDSKDWTWVLDGPCPDRGFDASPCPPGAVAGLVRANVAEWEALLADSMIHAGRPDDATWSSLEYACHVRDVYRRYDQRVGLMMNESDPLFPNWDQDRSAVEDRYDEQNPTRVVEELGEAASTIARRLDGLTGAEWVRPGRRSDGASFTIDSIARYMIHDPIHHVWDVTRSGPMPSA